MKNHERLNKISRNSSKITMQLVTVLLILAFASCEKEELLEPVQEVHDVDEPVKATAQIGPRLSLRISRRTYNAAYDGLRQHHTVLYNGGILAAITERMDGSYSSKIWSSSNGSEWTVRSNFPVGKYVTNMIVHNNEIWALCKLGYDTGDGIEFWAYTSTDGGLTWNPVSSGLPFYGDSPAHVVVFNHKILVFGEYIFSNSDNNNKKVFSSIDGINWISENIRGLPIEDGTIPSSGAPTIVFKDALYFFTTAHLGTATPSEIFKSTNGRDWSRVSGATPDYLNPTENFPLKLGYSVVAHDNKVWITGGKDTASYSIRDSDYSNDIWYSGDMKNWRKYTGYVSFKPLYKATLLSSNNEMLLLGGYLEGTGRWDNSKYVWSIKPKIKYYVPVEIPRDRPAIPRF